MTSILGPGAGGGHTTLTDAVEVRWATLSLFTSTELSYSGSSACPIAAITLALSVTT